MADIPLPFVGEDLDTSEPGSSAKTIVMLIAGGAILTMALAYAQRGGNFLIELTDQALGAGGNEVDVV